MESKKKKIIAIVGILLVLGIIAGISYALWNITIVQEDINNMTTSCLNLEMTGKNAIDLQETYPLTDEEAKSLTPYTFTIKNNCNTSVSYKVSLEMMETENRLQTEYVAIAIDEEEKKLLNTLEETETIYDQGDYTPVEGRVILSGELRGEEAESHSIKVWLDEHVTLEDDAMNKNFISKVIISASPNPITKYQESILNGAYPVLADNLIPVEVDDTGKVTKADITKEWYSYENKRWANAVILLDKTIEYENNEEIPEENIESYFVWIPKYSYELWDLGEYTSLTSLDTSKVHTIPIKFGIENTSDSNSGECTTPMTSGATGNCKVGDYMTPPAFITMIMGRQV